jgi:hypothetical protein
MNMIAVPTTLRPSPRPEVHQRMELPPAVVIGVEKKGLGEEEQHVREERRGEHAHQVVRELRIEDDEHERQERAERRGERERDRQELRELVRQPVVAHVTGLVADRLDDQTAKMGTARTKAANSRWSCATIQMATRLPMTGNCRYSTSSYGFARACRSAPPARRPAPGARRLVDAAAGARYGSLYSRLAGTTRPPGPRRTSRSRSRDRAEQQELAVS